MNDEDEKYIYACIDEARRETYLHAKDVLAREGQEEQE